MLLPDGSSLLTDQNIIESVKIIDTELSKILKYIPTGYEQKESGDIAQINSMLCTCHWKNDHSQTFKHCPSAPGNSYIKEFQHFSSLLEQTANNSTFQSPRDVAPPPS